MPTISRTQTSQAAVAQPTSTHDGYTIPEGNTVPPGFQNPHLPDTVPGSLGLYVAGTAGDDQLFGSDYADSIFGFAGNDSLPRRRRQRLSRPAATATISSTMARATTPSMAATAVISSSTAKVSIRSSAARVPTH